MMVTNGNTGPTVKNSKQTHTGEGRETLTSTRPHRHVGDFAGWNPRLAKHVTGIEINLPEQRGRNKQEHSMLGKKSHTKIKPSIT